MNYKLSTCGVIISILFFSLSHAQDWRESSLPSTTSDHWRNSPNRWKKEVRTKIPAYWRVSPNQWNKRRWPYSPLNWRHSDLLYKNTMEKYEGSSDYQQIKIWVPVNIKEEKKPVSDEKKEYAQPKIETIDEEINKGSENTSSNTELTEDYFVLINSKGSFRLDKSAQVKSHMAPGGLMEIYSSGSENE